VHYSDSDSIVSHPNAPDQLPGRHFGFSRFSSFPAGPATDPERSFVDIAHAQIDRC
jgi:hypothetical protein